MFRILKKNHSKFKNKTYLSVEPGSDRTKLLHGILSGNMKVHTFSSLLYFYLLGQSIPDYSTGVS